MTIHATPTRTINICCHGIVFFNPYTVRLRIEYKTADEVAKSIPSRGWYLCSWFNLSRLFSDDEVERYDHVEHDSIISRVLWI